MNQQHNARVLKHTNQLINKWLVGGREKIIEKEKVKEREEDIEKEKVKEKEKVIEKVIEKKEENDNNIFSQHDVDFDKIARNDSIEEQKWHRYVVKREQLEKEKWAKIYEENKARERTNNKERYMKYIEKQKEQKFNTSSRMKKKKQPVCPNNPVDLQNAEKKQNNRVDDSEICCKLCIII